jgi:tRNA C32,U32 (ribose-2'-O)-methylase TrmJ
VVYELSRGNSAVKPTNKLSSAAANMESIHRISAALLEALHASGYLHPGSAATAEEKLRRMLRRFQLSSADAEVLLGMLRKILWKMHQQE